MIAWMIAVGGLLERSMSHTDAHFTARPDVAGFHDALGGPESHDPRPPFAARTPPPDDRAVGRLDARRPEHGDLFVAL